MRTLGNAKLCLVAALAAGIVAVSASDALAWWGKHRGGSYGSYGSYGGSYASYGSYGSYGSAGSYDSYGSYGGGGLFARWHAKKAMRKGYGSYGSYASYGSYDGYGSSGGYAVSYGSYGSYGSSGSYGGVIYDAQPADAMSAEPPAAPTEAAPQDGAAPQTPQPGLEGTPPQAPPSASAREASIWVSVPADAKVFVNDLATRSLGTERHYVSRGLERGRSYSYKLRVEFERDGQPVVEDKLIRLQAGSSVQLAFGNGQPAEEATAKTELKLHVPAEAKVTLAGAATKQTGEVRTYATSGLKTGQKWNGYTVRVELEQEGKTLTEEKTMDIEGGKSYELSFEMAGDSLKVAAVN
jgi:uncharacterized protein (TIGR03000 family)